MGVHRKPERSKKLKNRARFLAKTRLRCWTCASSCQAVVAAFWRVGADYLRVYADIGLHAVPLQAREADRPRYLALRAERDLESLRPLLPPEMRRAAEEQERSRAA